MEVASYRISGLIALKTLSDVGSRLSSFLLLLLAARFLDPFEFGLFSLAWATGWGISIASDLGLQLFVAREVARNPEQAGQFVPPLFRVRLYLGSILFGVIGLAHWVLWWDTGGPIFLGLVLVQFFSSVIEFFNHLFRGFGRTDLESWANLLHRLGALLAGGFVLATSSSLSLLTCALLSMAAAITLLTWYWAVTLVRENKKSSGDLRAEPERNTSSLSRTFRAEILPIGRGILASGVYFRLDLLFLEWFRDASAVGRYTAVFRLVDAARLFPAAVIAVLFPSLCRSRSKSLAAALAVGLGLVAVTGAMFLRFHPRELVLFLYGEAYATADPVLSILALALPPLFVNLVLTHQLIAWRRPLSYMWACVAVLILTIPLNSVLIPSGGAIGAAWAVLVREIFLGMICGGFIWFTPIPGPGEGAVIAREHS